MKQKKADIVSVAKGAKVSASTVSRYFNHPELVKLATRRKIEAAVRKQGYIRNRAAQTIHGIRSGTIGVVVPTLDHAIFAEVVQAFSDKVADLGFTILLASHGYDLDREYAVARKMLEHRVDGLALIGLDHAEETFLLIERQETPAMLLWNYEAGSRLPSVGSDNFKAGRLIEEQGLKGTRIGGAEISTVHANFIVNTGDAEAKDIAQLIQLVQNRIEAVHGIRLHPEVKRLGFASAA